MLAVFGPGTSVTYSTTAGGTGPYTYQWNRNGVPLVGLKHQFLQCFERERNQCR